MPRTAITANNLPGYGAGVVVTKTNGDATNHHQISNNNGKYLLVIENNGIAPTTVTFPSAVAGTRTFGITPALNATGETVANGTVRAFGPFAPDVFNDSTNHVRINLSVDTSVTLYVLNLDTALRNT